MRVFLAQRCFSQVCYKSGVMASVGSHNSPSIAVQPPAVYVFRALWSLSGPRAKTSLSGSLTAACDPTIPQMDDLRLPDLETCDIPNLRYSAVSEERLERHRGQGTTSLTSRYAHIQGREIQQRGRYHESMIVAFRRLVMVAPM